ncbi:hypothetical protein SETIT_9G431500v2 [Setaria italica]|uniref:Uncharacterized protein n=1 Tax=Setaria italica TaxID=4555 RepID=A0A368SRZ6_SETIT|nr:hypothetical protein SETIT_9G431500v2 [Setaria italica]RCV45164.1 hypothetical protein SETIT_9G431500v2 [Setaria italica]RCV45165.1 hypothetical protein SETIT_9G431500v2 [Setaria italica]RCV45166.1 hypothetical protein SETIT_9G431500v2 [Setaria italica]
MYAARTSVLRPVAPPPPSASRAASFLHCAEHPPGGTPPAGSPPSSATPGHLRAPHAGAPRRRVPSTAPRRRAPCTASHTIHSGGGAGKREEVPHRVAAATHKRNKAAAAKEHGRALAFAHLHVMLLQSVFNVYSGSRRPTSSAWPRPSLRDPDIVLDLGDGCPRITRNWWRPTGPRRVGGGQLPQSPWVVPPSCGCDGGGDSCRLLPFRSIHGEDWQDRRPSPLPHPASQFCLGKNIDKSIEFEARKGYQRNLQGKVNRFRLLMRREDY